MFIDLDGKEFKTFYGVECKENTIHTLYIYNLALCHKFKLCIKILAQSTQSKYNCENQKEM